MELPVSIRALDDIRDRQKLIVGRLMQYNVVISVLSMFILLAKSTLYVLHGFLPIIGLLVSVAEIAIYAVSIHRQSGPDMTDPRHPSPGLPWYLSKGCSYATPGNWGYCMQARAIFGVMCAMV